MSSLEFKTVKELKDILRSLNLKVSGNKSVLIDRLNDHGYTLPYTTKTQEKKTIRYIKSPKYVSKTLPKSPKYVSKSVLRTSPIKKENPKEIVITALRKADLELEEIIDILEKVYDFDFDAYDFKDFIENEGFLKPKDEEDVEELDLRRIPNTRENLNKLKIAQLRTALITLGEAIKNVYVYSKSSLIDKIIELKEAEYSSSESGQEYSEDDNFEQFFQ